MTQSVSTVPVVPGGHAVRVEDVPDPEVGERASRRTYTARYKLEILAEYERLDKAEKGALLRREGLYTSLISAWREQRDRGALAAMEATSRGPKPLDPAAREKGAPGGGERPSGRRAGQGPAGDPCAGGTVRALGAALEGERGPARERAREVIDAAVVELTPVVGVKAACEAVGRSRASHYRGHPARPVPLGPAPAPATRKPQPRALTEAEQAAVLDVLHSELFVDQAPEAVYATLLDEGTYLCSIPTMYRLLRARGETNGGQDRRRHATHPAHVKPELVATQPNRVWSWDITKLRGPAKWTYYYLYVILDIYSRYVVGWMVATRESKILAERLFAETIRKQGIDRDQLTIHADRGSSMTSKPVAFLLADLGVTKSHSRPHVSNDNPHSESQFRTLKYRPDFPDRFASIEDSRVFCARFFPW